MTWYQDLAICRYFDIPEVSLIAVGWLDFDKPFPKGDVERHFFSELVALAEHAWQPTLMQGRHPCAMCQFTAGPHQLVFETTTVHLGALNIFVPSRDGIYVAPSLILHYIDAHRYKPPMPFMEAVHWCPPMRSPEYMDGLRTHGMILEA